MRTLGVVSVHKCTPLKIGCALRRWGKLVKPDKITKLKQTDGAMSALKKFCDSSDRAVFVYEADGELTASGRLPPASKMGKKLLSFSKNEADEGVTLEVGMHIHSYANANRASLAALISFIGLCRHHILTSWTRKFCRTSIRRSA